MCFHFVSLKLVIAMIIQAQWQDKDKDAC